MFTYLEITRASSKMLTTQAVKH